jgi:hypothetical protein
MWTWPDYQHVAPPLPTTLRHCKTCARQTPHEIRTGSGVIATICVPCLQRALQYELDRD